MWSINLENGKQPVMTAAFQSPETKDPISGSSFLLCPNLFNISMPFENVYMRLYNNHDSKSDLLFLTVGIYTSIITTKAF